ncbi:MAG: tetratricopeptide repeat protein, partial [Pirellulaceae bacterium]
MVELIEPPHARNELAELGRAYGRLPDNLRELTADQQAFLDRAVDGLTENGKIICIRLTLLAEMVKGKPWNPDTWKDVGGVEGLGTAFLDATFASPSAPVVYRRHASTAQAVLRALLPELGTNIIGGRRSERALRDAAGGDAAVFSEVIRILDKELRLISPSDSDGFVAPTSSDAAESTDARYYQLSHDFLIPILRDWFNRRQRGTYRGRAELRLAELAALWNSKPENRYLPGSWEFVRLWSLTRSTSWTDGQRKMMRRGGRRHATRAVLLLAALPLFAWLGQEMFGRYHARRLVDQLPRTSIGELRVVADQVAAYAKWAVPLLREKTRAAAGNAVARRNLSLALLRADPRNHEQLIDFLYSEMLRAEAHELPAIREILASQSRKLNNRLWTVLIERGRDPGQQRLRAAGALASFDPGNAQWDDVAPEVAKQLVAVSHVHLKDWMSSLYPMRDKLLAPLTEIYRAANGGSPESVLAAHILVNYAADRPAVLADLISDATEAQFAIVFPALQRQGRQAIERLEAEIARTGEPSWHDEPLPVGWGSIDAALNAEIEAAEGLLTDRFAFVQTMPAERFFVACEALQSKGYRPAKFRPYQWLPSPPEDGCGERETPHLYVAAVWTRDGRDFVLKLDASPDELRAQDVRLRGEFFAPVDVAGYVLAAEGGSVDRYAGLWIKDSAAVDEVQLVVGVKAEFAPDHQQRHREGLHGVTMHQFLAADGRYRFSCIYRRQSEPTTIHRSQDVVNFANKAAQQQLQHDIALSEWEHVAFDRNYYEKILSQAEQALRVNPDNGEALRSRGVAQHALRRDALAVEDLTTVLAANPKDVTALWMRASSHARLGNAAAAASDVALTSQPVHHESHAPFVRAVVSAWQGDTSPLRLFRDMLAVHSHEWRWLYNAACAHAVAVSALEQDAESSANLAHEALDLLRRAVTAGFPHPSAIWSDPDLNSIRHRDEYRKILADAGFGHSISSVWGTSSAYESVVLHGIPPRELRARCQELVAQHYRPVAISVANVSP